MHFVRLYVSLSYIVYLVVVHPITDIELRYPYIVKRQLHEDQGQVDEVLIICVWPNQTNYAKI